MDGPDVRHDGSTATERREVRNARTAPDANCQSNRHLHSDRPNSGWKVGLFFFVLGSLFSVVPILNAIRGADDNKDYSHWYKIGRSVLAGEPLYEDVRNGEPEYMYPPTAAVLFYAPLSILPPVAFVIVLGVLTSASWAFSAWAAIVLMNERGCRNFCSAILPGMAVAPYIWDVQFLGQANLLLLALTLAAWLLLRFRHPLIAGGFFGAAVSLKAFPLSAIAYFCVRRERKAVVASMISIVALVWLIPGIVRGLERTTLEIRQWASMMIVDQSGETMAGRSSIGFTRRNQSLVSLSHRLLRHVDAGDDPNKPLYVNFADVSPRTAQFIGHAVCLLLGFVLLLACRFCFAPSPECEGLEVAMVCTLVPLCSPLAWTYFFCWMLPAWTAIGCWLHNPLLQPRERRRTLVGASTAGLLLASAISEQIDPTLQACGVTTIGATILFLTLAYVRFRLPNCALIEIAQGPASDTAKVDFRRHPR